MQISANRNKRYKIRNLLEKNRRTMKIRFIHCFLLFYLSLALGTGCTTPDTINHLPSEDGTEIVLEDYRLIEDETWEPEKTYIVHGSLEIPKDITLNISPGTTVKFGREARITVQGILKIGTPLTQEQVTQLVHLTSDNIGPAPGDWNGIFFDHTHDLESFIRGAVIQYATIALDIKTTSPTIAECTLRLNETGIALDGSDAHIYHNDILDNNTGISTIGRQTLPRIQKNKITKNETGIFSENVQSIIQHNNLNANVFALRLNVKFDFTIPNNWWGSADPIEIMDTIIDGGDPGLIAKQIGTVLYEPFVDAEIADAGFPYPTLLAELPR